MAAEKMSQGRKRKKASEPGESSQAKRARDSQPSSQESSSSFLEDEDNQHEAGRIKKICMKNFMCHSLMSIDLNQKVNFIVGANGSGKSAILTALTVGLGARATVTNRGPSIREFIKKGKSSAAVEITVTNEGPMAYRYDTYGPEITVIRNIGASSSYKIKNYEGTVISTKRNELENIVHALNIQVENPISVLNQDVSRNFLASNSSKAKYKLFMKATRLDFIGKNYRVAYDASEITSLRLEEDRKILIENEKEIEKLKKKLKTLESLDDHKLEYDALQKELQWAFVIQEEKKLLQIDVKIKEQEKVIDKLQNIEQTKAAKEKEIDVKIESFNEEIKQNEAEASESTSKLNEIKAQYAEAKKICDDKRDKARNFHADIKRKESDISTLQNEIAKLEREQREAGDKRQIAKQQSAEVEQQLDEVEATLRTKQTDLMHLEENKRRIEQDENRLRIDLNHKNENLNVLKRRLNSFKNQPNDALTVFGGNMPRLIRRIEEEHNRGRFRQKPLGPIGSFIKVKDSSWIPAIESHLGFGTLSSFCVDNTQDAKVLEIIMKEVYRNEKLPAILISKFINQMHDVRDGCVKSPKYKNLLQIMEITNPIIANSLIDQRQIECVLLIPTSEEACTVMDGRTQEPPRNCSRAITKKADLFYPDPEYRTYGGYVNAKPRYLQVSTNEAMQSLQEEINIAEHELELVTQEFREITQKKGNTIANLNEVQQQVKHLTRQQNQLKTKLEELRDTVESGSDNTINTFRNEMEELQRIVVQRKEEESHLLEEHRQCKKNVDSLSVELKRLRDLAQNLDARLNPIKEKIRELKDEKKRLSTSNQGAIRRMEEAKQHLQKLNGDHQQQQRVVNSKIEVAEQASQRIETKKSSDQINLRIKELKLIILNVEKQYGCKDALIAELKEKEEKFKDFRAAAIEVVKSNERQLKRLQKRKQFYLAMKKRISERVQASFTNILSLRNYKGKITIDHNQTELILEVTPQNDAKRPTNDAKALSGGERSYSTVAFILALWDSTSLPFYFLDEFDVFMDKINRRIILDILLNFAKSNPRSQFAFLTPLDTSHIIADNSITIHRLEPPERNT